MSFADNHMSLKHAMDWRFFLPISADSRILVIGADCEEYVVFLKRLGVLSIESMSNPSAIPGSQTVPFDMILVPQGLPSDAKSAFRRLKGLLAPQGILFIGFSNSWRPGNDSPANGHPLSLKKMSRMLKSAGLLEMKFLGLMGNLETPDYILPLEREAIGFVLHHKFRHKIPDRFGNLFFHPWITAACSYFFAAYFVMAAASGKVDR
jgi:hypothetical protein